MKTDKQVSVLSRAFLMSLAASKGLSFSELGKNLNCFLNQLIPLEMKLCHEVQFMIGQNNIWASDVINWNFQHLELG
jgi:hypothetical protein